MSRKTNNQVVKKDDTPVEENKVEETKIDETVEETVVEKDSTSVSTEEDTVKSVEQQLIEELKIEPIGRDTMTGKPVFPGIARLVREKELKQERTTGVDVSRDLVSKHVVDKYGEKALSDVTVKHMVSTLGEYVERMSPANTIDSKAGAEMQVKLGRMYDVVLNASPEVSGICLETIVGCFESCLDTVFSDRLALRFMDVARFNKDDAQRFQMLTTTFIELAKRSRLTNPPPIGETVNVQKLMSFIPDRNAKNNLVEFLS